MDDRGAAATLERGAPASPLATDGTGPGPGGVKAGPPGGAARGAGPNAGGGPAARKSPPRKPERAAQTTPADRLGIIRFVLAAALALGTLGAIAGPVLLRASGRRKKRRPR